MSFNHKNNVIKQIKTPTFSVGNTKYSLKITMIFKLETRQNKKLVAFQNANSLLISKKIPVNWFYKVFWERKMRVCSSLELNSKGTMSLKFF